MPRGRHTGSARRPAIALALFASLLAASIAVPGATVSASGREAAAAKKKGKKKLDFGDAPDGQPAGYENNPAVQGNFASTKGSRGPSHPKGGNGLVLGLESSVERDSRQVDRDTEDAGASLDGLEACSKQSRILVAPNARKLPKRAFAKQSKARIYVNAWFDWNRDGDFFDGDDGCAPEWGVQNLAISPRELGADGMGVLPIRLQAGQQVEELWWRVTVTLDQKVKGGPDGLRKKPYRYGETEDYLNFPVPDASAAAASASARSAHAAGSVAARGSGSASGNGKIPRIRCSGPRFLLHGEKTAAGLHLLDIFDIFPADLRDSPFAPIRPVWLSPQETRDKSGPAVAFGDTHKASAHFEDRLPDTVRFHSTRVHKVNKPLTEHLGPTFEQVEVRIRFEQDNPLFPNTFAGLARCLFLVEHEDGFLKAQPAPQPQRDDFDEDDDPLPGGDEGDDTGGDDETDGDDTDFDPDDPESTGPNDPFAPPQCSNGIDDDGDGAVDHEGGPNGEKLDPACGGDSNRNSEAPDGPRTFSVNVTDEGGGNFRVSITANDAIMAGTNVQTVGGFQFAGTFTIEDCTSSEGVFNKITCLITKLKKVIAFIHQLNTAPSSGQKYGVVEVFFPDGTVEQELRAP